MLKCSHYGYFGFELKLKPMIKLKFIIATIAVSTFLVNCTPENQLNEYQTDKTEVCPPNDKNCNGIPDDEE
jgi:hypothetical protein